MRKHLFLFLILPIFLSAQETILQGQIYADSISNYQVHIININQQIGSVSNSEGLYKIRANLNDSILFTSLQHKTHTLIVKESNLEHSTSIFLDLQVNELPEVTLNPYNLSGDLTQDVGQVKVDFIDQRKFGFGIPRELDKVDREINASGSGNLLSVDRLIHVLSGYSERLEKRKANAVLTSNKKSLLRKVSPILITSDLKIPEIYVEDFAYFCAEDENTMSLMKKNDPLALIDNLKIKALAYLNQKQISE